MRIAAKRLPMSVRKITFNYCNDSLTAHFLQNLLFVLSRLIVGISDEFTQTTAHIANCLSLRYFIHTLRRVEIRLRISEESLSKRSFFLLLTKQRRGSCVGCSYCVEGFSTAPNTIGFERKVSIKRIYSYYRKL